MARELEVLVVPVADNVDRPSIAYEALRFQLHIEHLAIPTTIESHDQRHERTSWQ